MIPYVMIVDWVDWVEDEDVVVIEWVKRAERREEEEEEESREVNDGEQIPVGFATCTLLHFAIQRQRWGNTTVIYYDA